MKLALMQKVASGPHGRGWWKALPRVWLACTPLWAGAAATSPLPDQGPACPVPKAFEQGVKEASADSFDALGLYFADRKQLSCAVWAFQQGVRLAPAAWPVRYDLAVALLRAGNRTEAAQQLRLVIEQRPDSLKVRNALGALLQEMGEWEEAVEAFQASLRVDPRSLFALYSLGDLYAARKLYPDAISYLQQAAAVAPRSAKAHLNLGIVLAEGADLESALTEFSKAASLAPGMAATRYNKGRALFELRRYKQAWPDLEAAVQLAPHSWHAVYLLAIAERELGHPQRSKQLLERSVSLEPRNADAQYALGQILAQAGMVGDAMRCWQKTLEINPQHMEANYSLFQALKDKEPQKATLYYSRFRELKQASDVQRQVETLDQMARVSSEAKDWPQAIIQLKRALEICRECSFRGSLHKKLGWTYIRSGNLSQGEQELRRALDLKPGDPDVEQWLKLIRTAPDRLVADQ